MITQSQGKFLALAALVAVIAIIGYYVLNTPDKRDTGEKISDSIDALQSGADKAARQLENRTPGEKLGDAVKDVGDDIKDATDR